MEKVRCFVEDRLSGMTFQEIADKHGVSKQYVHQRVSQLINGVRATYKPKDTTLKKVVYPNIRKWMLENKYSILRFEEKLDAGKGTLRNKLYGKSDFKKGEIDRLLALTGMTHETAFARGEADDV